MISTLKNIFDKKTLNIISIMVGLIFIFSGIGKAIDVVGFTNLIHQYGLGLFAPLAPVIILFEIVLGFSLILLMNPKRDSMISFGMLTIFTALFAYAHFVHGINDCGCFGAIKNTNFPPLFSFLRNVLLMLMSLGVWGLYPKTLGLVIQPSWKKYILISSLIIFTFICGLTVSSPLYSINFTHHTNNAPKFLGQNIKNTELANFYKTSSDSTYLFFCFSYTCPYCWNSIENLRSFIRNKTVDKVVTFAIGEESSKLIFNEKFKPDFPIINLNGESMDKLTLNYPTAFYVEHDTIKIVSPGELPSPFIFKR